jgi:hypothetical protein
MSWFYRLRFGDNVDLFQHTRTARQFPTSPATTHLQLSALADSSAQSNDSAEQVQLVLRPAELATIVLAVRAIGLHGFAARLEAILRRAER